MMYPHLFATFDPSKGEPGLNENLHPSRWVVIIAISDWTDYNSDWMQDPSLPNGHTLRPDVDLTQEEHYFDSEYDALKFIKSWWARQD